MSAVPDSWVVSDPVAQTVTTWTPDANGNPSSPVVRAFTAAELAAANMQAAGVVAAGNQAAIFTAIANQRANNLAFLGLASPTNAQVVAQVQALTRQNNAMMRLWVNDLTGTN